MDLLGPRRRASVVKGRAVSAAYSDTGSLQVACPHCGAEPGQWCTKSDGRVSKVPCVGRLAACTAVIAPITRMADVPVDFSEPRHADS